MAATLLGSRAFQTLGRKPCFPAPSVCYPWDWILPSLDKTHAQDLLRRVANWPPTVRLPVSLAACRFARPVLLSTHSTG